MSRWAVLPRLLFVLGIAFVALSEGAAAQPATLESAKIANEDAEAAGIRAESEAFVAAFNAADAKAIAAFWTDTGEYIDHIGQRFLGRDAIEKGYASLFTENPDIELQIRIDSLRMLNSDTAIEDGRALAVMAGGAADGFTQYTAIHVRENGKWKMASVRDTFIESPPAASSAADLAWLLGTWAAEEHGVKTVSKCRWVADGSFIERTYTATHVDGTTASGVELVGWNPSKGCVQSWSFGPDGGHAVGTWFSQQDGWVAHMQGFAPDGAPTSSINQLRRLDDDAYVWRSTQRSMGGMSLPDTHEVVWKRQANQDN